MASHRTKLTVAVAAGAITALAAGIGSFRRACGKDANAPDGGRRLSADWSYPYAQVADGGFAAFAGRRRVVVESRWQGPSFVVDFGTPWGFTVPFASPGGVRYRFSSSAAVSERGGLMAACARSPGKWWRVWVWHTSGSRTKQPVVMAGCYSASPGNRKLRLSPGGSLVAFLGWHRKDRRGGIIICSPSSGRYQETLRFPKWMQLDDEPWGVTFTSQRRVECACDLRKSSGVRILGWSLPSGRRVLNRAIKAHVGVWCMADNRSGHELLLSGIALPGRPPKMPRLLVVSSRDGALVSKMALGGLAGARAAPTFRGGVTASGIAAAPDGRFAVVVGFGRLAKRKFGSSIGGWLRIVDLRKRRVVFSTNDLAASFPWHVAISPGGNRIIVAANTRFFIVKAPFRL